LVSFRLKKCHCQGCPGTNVEPPAYGLGRRSSVQYCLHYS
jgi:hypothetical protein